MVPVRVTGPISAAFFPNLPPHTSFRPRLTYVMSKTQIDKIVCIGLSGVQSVVL